MKLDFNEIDKTLKEYKAKSAKGLFNEDNLLDITLALREYIKKREI